MRMEARWEWGLVVNGGSLGMGGLLEMGRGSLGMVLVWGEGLQGWEVDGKGTCWRWWKTEDEDLLEMAARW